MLETTSGLLQRLREDAHGDVLQQIQDDTTCAQMLTALLEQHGQRAAAWMAAIAISRSYGYQILRGIRRPGRDILLRTALCLQLSVPQTQRLLARGGCGALYPRVRRDAAVLFALYHRLSLLETEELLLSLPERSLYAGEG